MRFNWLVRYPIVGLCWLVFGLWSNWVPLAAQTDQDLVAFKRNGLWGLLNASGQVVQEPQYESFDKLSNGSRIAFLPPVHPDSAALLGLIGRDGKLLLPCVYNDYLHLVASKSLESLFNVKDTLLLLRRGQFIGIYTLTGKELQPCQFDEIFVPKPSHEYRRDNVPLIEPTNYNSLIYRKGKKEGFVGSKGQLMTPPIYESLEFIFHNHAIAKMGKFGLIDSVGKVALPFEYDTIYVRQVFKSPTQQDSDLPANSFHYVVKKGGRYGLVNLAAKPTTELVWDAAPNVHFDGTIEGYINGKPILIMNGKEYPNRRIQPIDNGMRLFETAPKHRLFSTVKRDFLPIDGNINYIRFKLSDTLMVVGDQNKRYGLMNTKGQIRQPFQWTNIEPFELRKMIDIKDKESFYVISQDEKQGLLSSSGKVIFDCQEQQAVYPNFAIQRRADSLVGVVAPSGKVLVPFQYQSVELRELDLSYFCDTQLSFWAIGKTGTTIFDIAGKTLFNVPDQFIESAIHLCQLTRPFDKRLAGKPLRFYTTYRESGQERLYGVIDGNGKTVLEHVYTKVSSFKAAVDQHLVMLEQSDKWGLYDLIARKWILPCAYDDITKEHLSYIKVKQGYQYGIVDSNGQTIVPIAYADVKTIRYIPKLEAYGTHRTDLFGVKPHDKWAIITPEGYQITDEQWAEVASTYSECIGVAVGKSWEGTVCNQKEWFYIDLSGKIRMSDSLVHQRPNVEAFTPVTVPKYSYVISDPFYPDAYHDLSPSLELKTYRWLQFMLKALLREGPFTERRATVITWNPQVAVLAEKKNLWRVDLNWLNDNGQPFFANRSKIRSYLGEHKLARHEYLLGEVQLKPTHYLIPQKVKNGGYRYLDTRTMQWRGTTGYKKAFAFNAYNQALVKTNKGYSLIDQNFQPLPTGQFRLTKRYREGEEAYYIKQEGKNGVRHIDGRTLVPTKYNSVKPFFANQQDTIWAVHRRKKRFGLWSQSQQKQVLSPEYAFISFPTDFKRFWVRNKQGWSLIDNQDKVLNVQKFTNIIEKTHSDHRELAQFRVMTNVAYADSQYHFLDLNNGQIIKSIRAKAVYRLDDSLYLAQPLKQPKYQQQYLLYNRRGQVVTKEAVVNVEKAFLPELSAKMRLSDEDELDDELVRNEPKYYVRDYRRETSMDNSPVLPAGLTWLVDTAYQQRLMVGQTVLDTFRYDALYAIGDDYDYSGETSGLQKPSGLVFERRGRYGYIDNKGKVKIAPKLTAMEYLPRAGYFLAMRGKEEIRMDTTGYLIDSDIEPIKPKETQDTLPNRSQIVFDPQQGAIGVVDKDGQVRIPFEYSRIYSVDDQYILLNRNGLYGLADSMGNVVMQPKWHQLVEVNWPKNRVIVILDGKYGIVTRAGEEVTPIQYDEMSTWNNGCSLVQLGEYFGCMDPDGKLLTPIEYTQAQEYACSCCPESLFTRMRKGNQTALAINGRIEMVGQPYQLHEAFGNGLVALYDEAKKKYGFYNWKLKAQVSDFVYDAVRVEEKGVSAPAEEDMVSSYAPTVAVEEEEPSSSMSMSPERPAFRLADIGVVVRQGDKYGLLLADGKGIPCQFDDVDLIYPNLAIVRQGEHWYLADLTGRIINPSFAIDGFGEK
jgi:hypothetical protein